MGEIEARHAIEKVFGNNTNELYHDTICTIMFLNPEVGVVGLNEQQCIEQNIPVKVVKIDFSVIARAIAMRKTEGFFKIIVSGFFSDNFYGLYQFLNSFLESFRE